MKSVLSLVVLTCFVISCSGSCPPVPLEYPTAPSDLPGPPNVPRTVHVANPASWLCSEPDLSGECLILRGEPIALEIHEDDWPALLVGAERWNEWTGVQIFTFGSETNVFIILREEFAFDKPDDLFHVMGVTTAVDEYGCVIEIREDLLNDVDLMTHELGHCIGFIHSDYPESIMWFALGLGQHLTEGHRLVIQEFYGE